MMYRVYCVIGHKQEYRYYWHKPGCWSIWADHAAPVSLEKAIRLVNAEESDRVYYEPKGAPTPTPTVPQCEPTPTVPRREPTPTVPTPTPTVPQREPTPMIPTPTPTT
jgi:hypothetical protein